MLTPPMLAHMPFQIPMKRDELQEAVSNGIYFKGYEYL
jgi:hypothetical protein